MSRVRKLSADWVFPVSQPPIPHGVVIVDDQGTILEVEGPENHDPATLEKRHGALVPGFINTHCHLELSHMKGRAPTGTGLIAFIEAVVRDRSSDPELIRDAIEKAEEEMRNSGIVAVGDISNQTDTVPVKHNSPLRYYTFVECFDFLEGSAKAREALTRFRPAFDEIRASDRHRKALVPHAPYSVSGDLFGMLRSAQQDTEVTISIHNQETPEEDRLFQAGESAFRDFYQRFGNYLPGFRPTGTRSIHYAMAHMDPGQRTLFVHNTCTGAEDVRAAHDWSDRVYWATCPNANLYIENRLPDYRMFVAENARMTIGTDSLTSNWQLSILEEMKTIQKYNSWIPFEVLLRWATLHGAEALGFDRYLGSLDKGKRPGILLLEGEGPAFTTHPGSGVTVLVPAG